MILLSIFIISFARSVLGQGLLNSGFSENINFLANFNEPSYPAKPDPVFPFLKIIVAPNFCLFQQVPNRSTIFKSDKIDPDNLDNFTERFNMFPTVIFSFGFLDTSAVSTYYSSYFGKFTDKITPASLLSLAYFTVNSLAFSYKFFVPNIAQPPASFCSNFVVLDWSAYNTDYLQSLNYMPHIANLIGDKLYELSQNSSNPFNLSKFHFIGLSLGAHMVGMIARRIKDRTGKIVIPRVTGLDPAGPLIEFPIIRDFYPRLDKDCGININTYIYTPNSKSMQDKTIARF